MDGTTVVFREEGKAWRGPGAPPVAVPPELAAWLDRTYRDKSVCEIPCERASEDAALLVRLARIYARRKGLAISHQFFERDDAEWIRLRMRNKRQYHRTNGLVRERR
jgi:hypothetical protein